LRSCIHNLILQCVSLNKFPSIPYIEPNSNMARVIFTFLDSDASGALDQEEFFQLFDILDGRSFKITERDSFVLDWVLHVCHGQISPPEVGAIRQNTPQNRRKSTEKSVAKPSSAYVFLPGGARLSC